MPAHIRTVWRYPLRLEAEQVINVPAGGKFIHLATYRARPTLFVEVDPHARPAPNTIEIYRTGLFFDDHPRQFLGQFQAGGYCHHVYLKL